MSRARRATSRGARIGLSLVLAGAMHARAQTPETGWVVESVFAGDVAERAGMRAGDRLTSWAPARACADDSGRTAGAEIVSPFEVAELERTEAPRCTLVIHGRRGAEEVSFELTDGDWGARGRPVLDDGQFAAYERARQLATDGQFDEALAQWRALAEDLRGLGRALDGVWADLRVADTAVRAKRWPEAEKAFETARSGARAAGDRRVEVDVWISEAGARDNRDQLEQAEAGYREALRLEVARAAESLRVARILRALGLVLHQRGDFVRAKVAQRRALAIQSRLAPESLGVERCLNALGTIAYRQGELQSAERLLTRALAIAERHGETGLTDMAGVLSNLGAVLSESGDLAGAEARFRRSLSILEVREPGSVKVAGLLNNVSTIADNRGDHEAAEKGLRAALTIYEKLTPRGVHLPRVLDNLGNLARERGEWDTAEDFLRRGLALREQIVPDSLDLARSCANLGTLLRDKGDLAQAEEFGNRALTLREKHAPKGLVTGESVRLLAGLARDRGDALRAQSLLERALAIDTAAAPEGLDTADTLAELGEVVRERGDLARAEELYRRALAVHVRAVPGSARVARSWHGLALVLWPGARKAEAVAAMAQALDALEAQQGKLGGSEGVRASFAARYAAFYHEAAEQLLELGRAREAFQVLERSRARALLDMLAERDIVFADVTPALNRERRRVDAEYDRAQARLADLTPAGDAAQIAKLRLRLRELRAQRTALERRVRSASPRLAALQYPRPLDVAGASAVLDTGTLLLSYSVGRERTLLFVLGARGGAPAAAPLATYSVPLGEAQLRQRVDFFRGLIEGGHGTLTDAAALQVPAARLYDELLRPAQAQIRKARRLLIVPDGPLHLLPFAALVTSLQPLRYLAEDKPLHTVLSATLYAELRAGRRPSPRGDAATLVALGDPSYARAEMDSGTGELREGVVARTRVLKPLPASREEVQRIAGAFASGARAYLGAEATEERARSLGAATSYVHFAVHGVLDRRFPLDSALAFSPPPAGAVGRANGLLQAWEIFESVRLQAELVTLSACETGLGPEAGGEGLISLSRAFQYAGARSVLASMWAVSDRSTSDLMARFYAGLAQGLPKDDALQAAQVQALRVSGASHPFHWAAFQLNGDWK